ncbi:MAG: aminotransferase class I/II-fold pyridoxal phosphate-dependent enzyme [Planctomycetes bacterium]|nr:aminotransferase class I/II-fold pyridoxal phosphate-dependent enzyme [Planctomycetota bacterium]
MTSVLDFEAMISARARSIDVSGIRRVFELGARLEDPINLSIGQPDFAVPDPIKRATVQAVEGDRNGYTLTQGAPELLEAISRRLADDVGWDAPSDEHGLLVTGGTSGALLLACLALLDPGDEIIVPDPFFVIYPALGSISGARVVYCDTYPDFRMTAERVEPLLTDRTKIVLIDSPGNPAGVVLTGDEQRDLATLCEERGVVLISDEIYDAFTYADSLEEGRCPSPARYSRNMLLVRGFGKTYGCTGWRLGYAAGPKSITMQMAKLQQYTFVCAPSMAQVGASVAFDVDMSGHVAAYQRKRDMVLEAFSSVADVVHPGGAFYVFVPVPEHLGMSGTEFAERATERNVLVIPGGVFSQRDTHFRISYATPDDRLAAGLEILRDLAAG